MNSDSMNNFDNNLQDLIRSCSEYEMQVLKEIQTKYLNPQEQSSSSIPTNSSTINETNESMSSQQTNKNSTISPATPQILSSTISPATPQILSSAISPVTPQIFPSTISMNSVHINSNESSSVPASTPSKSKPHVKKNTNKEIPQCVVSHEPSNTIAVSNYNVCIKSYNEYNEIFERIKNDTNEPYKTFKNQSRKEINHDLSIVSAEINQITKCISYLLTLFKQYKSKSEDYYRFGVLFLFQRIIDLSKNATGLEGIAPLCVVLMYIILKEKKLRDPLLGCIYVNCPLCVPLYIEQGSLSEKEWKQKQGYSNNGEEPEEKYIKRMGNIMYIYSSLIQIEPFTDAINPMGPELGWLWIAHAVNVNLQKLHPTFPMMLCNFLKTAGNKMMIEYKNQFDKILTLIQKRIVPIITKDTRIANIDKENIDVFFKEYQKNRTIEKPSCLTFAKEAFKSGLENIEDANKE
ncbi:hypothetical protein WA158_007402 [Blastocystis sp. Blastoise]